MESDDNKEDVLADLASFFYSSPIKKKPVEFTIRPKGAVNEIRENKKNSVTERVGSI